MKVLLRQLKGGDRHSVRGVPEVIDQVMADPRLFPAVFDGMADAYPLVRMRCSDAIEKITAGQPVEVVGLRRQFASWLGLGDRRPDLVVRFGCGPEMPRSPRRPIEQVLI